MKRMMNIQMHNKQIQIQNTEVQKLTEVKCLALQGGNQEKEEGKTHSNLVSHRLFWKRLQILMPSFKCVVDIVDSKKVF